MNYRDVFTVPRLWAMLGLTFVVSFGVLLYEGEKLADQAPPIPTQVVTTDGAVFFTKADIHRGQEVWARLGGMQFGSIWGHGAYLAPDWTTDVLHREAVAALDSRAARSGGLDSLEVSERAGLIASYGAEVRANTYDPETGEITITRERARAMRTLLTDHYTPLLGGTGDSAEYQHMREQIALQNAPLGAEPDEDIRALFAYWWWSAWAAGTLRPGDANVTYTNNWPHEPLVGNKPTGFSFIWSILSIVLLIGCIGLLAWFFNRERTEWELDLIPEGGAPTTNPLDTTKPTASMRAVHKYIWVVLLLLGAQMSVGIITAHYAVEGQQFYGFNLSDFFPYALSRTWHVQLSVLWIAVAWLGVGLYAAPLISGREPTGQHHLVNFLFVALIIATVGALGGQMAAINGWITDPDIVFWFGHQGYEFLDLGRFWQILIFVGLILWGGMMTRCIWPALQEKRDDKTLLYVLLLSTVGIAGLFGAGLLYDRHTNLAISEYWRWWVVHLWVEGIFEVFATAWIAWVFVHMRLLRAQTAGIYVMFSTMIFLGGGVLGTFHHLYFTGTQESVLAIGAVFSALEVVPLTLIAFEAHDHWSVEKNSPWVKRYHLPLKFFLAVAFWNLVGAGVLGFLINPPIALYYMQGLMTTPAHGHAALFGVYGMLGLGLMLFCRRGLKHNDANWSDKKLNWVFWCLNIGLAMMVFGSILPQGLTQVVVSFDQGYWFARDASLMRSDWMEFLVWMRVPGDIVFAVGVVLFLYLLFKLDFGPKGEADPQTPAKPTRTKAKG